MLQRLLSEVIVEYVLGFGFGWTVFQARRRQAPVCPRLSRRWSASSAAERGEPDDGSRYYEHWLAALERLVIKKGLKRCTNAMRRGRKPISIPPMANLLS